MGEPATIATDDPSRDLAVIGQVDGAWRPATIRMGEGKGRRIVEPEIVEPENPEN